MNQVVYTRFPLLFAEPAVPNTDASSVQHHFDFHTSETDLLRAWARLLSQYTGHDDWVAFFFNDQLVRVSISDGNIEQEHGSSDGQESPPREATAIYSASYSKEIGGYALELHFDTEARKCDLYSNGSIPQDHLAQIASLFQRQLLSAEKTRKESTLSGASDMRLSILNEQPKVAPGPKLLHELVFPTGPVGQDAIEYYESLQVSTQVSYVDLWDRATELSQLIRQRVRRKTSNTRRVVPLLVPQSPALYIAMLAVLQAGFAFCPLQLDAPPERLKFILEDVQATLILTTEDLAHKIPSVSDLDVLCVHGKIDCSCEVDGEEEDEGLVLDSKSTAYVMYTSGSTGKPKGVPVSHRAATQSLLAHDRHVPKFSRFLQFAAPTFDVSIFEIFFTLYRRCTLVVCERTQLLGDLPRAMREVHVDAAELTPTVAGGLLRSRKNAPELKLLLTIGEMLTPQVVAEFGGDNTNRSLLWGMYGPTEAAIHCTLQPAFSRRHRPSNIGVPLDTVSAFIVPPAGSDPGDHGITEILPIGFVGELAVGGHQLADGYINREEQTSQVFVQTKENGMLYRTGDKARILLDGTIECLGRIVSGQVKLRGQRIELGEVRHAVSRTHGCIDAVISILDDIMVAFCLVEGNVRSEDVVRSCRDWLPAFMVPSDVIILADFPRLPSGKADLKALEVQYKANKVHHASLGTNSLGPAAKTLCTILETALARAIDPDASLGAIGLDSLSAIRVASLARKEGIGISFSNLLGSQSIRALESEQKLPEVQSEASKDVATQQPLFAEVLRLFEQKYTLSERRDFETVFPPTPMQLAMLAETEKDRSAYCNWVELELDRRLDHHQVEQCFHQLARKHSMLRSGFCSLDSSLVPYACVVHSRLQTSQLEEVQSFTRTFSLQDRELLRPFKVQVLQGEGNTRLLLQMHHSLYDGWSMDVLAEDFQRALTGNALEPSASFAEISRFYTTVDQTGAMDYWQDHLTDYVPTRFPNFNGVRIAPSQVEVESLIMDLDFPKVTETAHALQIGVPVMFQAALVQMLGIYLGSTDVMLGTVTSGRSIPIPGIERIFGPCLATCPLRVDVAQHRSVADLLRHVQHLNRRMLQHAVVSPQAIKHICDFAPDQPLWDVLFVWQESLSSRNTGQRKPRIIATGDKLECALTIEFEPKDGRVYSKATFHNSLLPRAQVHMLLAQLENLLHVFMDNTDLAFPRATGLLSSKHLSISNPSPDWLHFDHGLEHAVERHAREHPDTIALLFATYISESGVRSISLTYKQLNDRANQLAHFLRRKDLKSAELIAICMEKSVDLYVSILAVLKLGLGYLPITPNTPVNRIKTIINEAGVHLCLSHRTSVTEGSCEVLCVDSIDLREMPACNVHTAYDGSKAAYVVFTSGSTGVPKGVLVTQQNLRSNLAVLSEIYPTAIGDRLLQACSQAFDVSVFEIFFTWQQGMCLCSASNDVLFRDLEMAIRSLEVTHLSLTPTVAALIEPGNVPKVKFLVTAGEGVTEKVKNAWSDRGLFQGYGPSETTNICTVKPNVRKADAIRNIGRAFRNTSAFVLDVRSDVILPMGAVGELCFGGDQVYRGYINQPELTASKFIQYANHGRLYRSGDSGRILPDGSIIFAARLDDQVKIRGQRVELHEINNRILQMEQVIDCATIVSSTSKISDALISFVVPRSLDSTSARSDSLFLPIESSKRLQKELLTLLQDDLPSYMVPAAILPIRAIPMTSQGKIDHRRLKAALVQHHENEHAFENPSNDDAAGQANFSAEEQAIIHTLQGTLGSELPRITRTTSFFSLGLDSISAIQFSRRISKHLNKEVAISTILRNPSVGRLAQYLAKEPPDTRADISEIHLLPPDLISMARDSARRAGVSVTKVLPCSPLQEAMLSSSAANAGMYHNITTFRVAGDLDTLKTCWEAMFERHEILRTSFLSTSSLEFPFVQVVLSGLNVPWLDMDRDVNAAQTQLPAPVDTFRPPIQLIAFTKESDLYITFECNHALYDGTAMGILVEEIQTLYEGRELPPPGDATFLWKQMIEQRQARHVSFWTEHFGGFGPTVLQCSNREQSMVSQPASRSLKALEDTCRSLSSSLLSVCQVAWARTLSALFGDFDICFGNVVSGRTSLPQDLDHLVAPTFNTVPFRINLRQNSDILDVLKAAQRLNAASIEHQFCPLRLIQSKLGFAETGIFASLLLLQSSQVELDPSIWSIEQETGAMDFPLILELIPNRRLDTFSANLYHYNSVLYLSEAKNILGYFLSTLDDISESPTRPIHKDAQFSHAIREKIAEITIRPVSSHATMMNGHSNHRELSENEELVCRAISELINVASEDISLTMSIHQLGIDSIGAIQLAAKLRAARSSDITAAAILRDPKIGRIAKLLHPQVRGHELPEPPTPFDVQAFSRKHISHICADHDIAQERVQHIWPCTAVQMGMLSRLLSGGSTYINHVSYALEEHVDSSRIFAAWKTVTDMCEMLRAGFFSLEDADVPFGMIVHGSKTYALPVEEADSNFELRRWRHQQAENFRHNLIRPPWACVIQVVKGKTLMHLTIFHGLYDATSLAAILGLLKSQLRHETTQKSVSIPNLISVVLGQTLSRHQDHETYWTNEMQGATFNAFPDLTPLHVSTMETCSVVRTMAFDVTTIEQKCQARGYSVQAVGQAAWARVLSAYLGEESIMFGVVLSGRDVIIDAGEAVFPCLITLPFSISLNDRRNDELLQKTMSWNASVRAHQFCKLSDIQRWASMEVLFDTIFAYQKITPQNSENAWRLIDDVASDEFSLSIELEPNARGDMSVRATFRTNVLPAQQAALLIRQYEASFMDILESPNRLSVSHVYADQHLLSRCLPEYSVLESPVALLHEFVEYQARQIPNKLALEFSERNGSDGLTKRVWTYHDLDVAGNRVAHLLAAHGIEPGSYIGVCFDKCPEASFAMLGVLKAGCAYVAIDPTAPNARKSFIATDSKMRLILSSDRAVGRLAEMQDSVTVVYLDETDMNTLASAPLQRSSLPSPDETCYCLYTSGTTGTPKGCEITHRNAVQAMRAFSILFAGRWNEDSKWLQFASFHFDVSVLEQYWSWSEGICVVSAPRDVIFEDLEQTIRSMGITHIDLTPSLASLVHPANVPNLCRGVFITGGEQLKQEILDEWGEHEVIHNGYGPTETTIGVTMFTRVPRSGKPANIGRQFANVGTYVVHPGTCSPVLRGGIGELCIAGQLVGKGYLNRPDLTAEKFPFVEAFNERIYRTGDLVRLCHDGTFLFLGRIDDQVKLRGQRLEVGEINSVVHRAIAGLSNVATYVLRHPKQQSDQLVTFFVQATQPAEAEVAVVASSPEASDLILQARAACLDRLPGYMVPTFIIPVTRMPLSTNNKTDAKILRRLFCETSIENLQKLSSACETEMDDTEKHIAETISALASVPMAAITSTSNMFELGLDSISIIALCGRLKRSRFHFLSVSQVMSNPILRNLAKSVRDQRAAPSEQLAVNQARYKIKDFMQTNRGFAADVFRCDPDRIEAIAPCTPLQEGMISRYLNQRADGQYFSTFRFVLNADVDIRNLEVAWQRVCSELQVLRTCFLQTNDGYAQVVFKSTDIPFQRHLLEESPSLDEAIQSSRQLWLRANKVHFRRPLEVNVWIGKKRTVMSLNIFHGLYDGNCLGKLLSDVRKSYLIDNRPDERPKFHDALPHGPLLRFEEAKSFWIDQLKHHQNSQLDINGPPSETVATVELGEELDSFRRSLNVTHQAIVQAAWAATLMETSHAKEATMGLVCSGRAIDFEDAENVIGPMFNTIPFCASTSSTASWRSLVQQCHEFNVHSLRFQHTPLRDIQKWVRSTSGLFDALFMFQIEHPQDHSGFTNALWSFQDQKSQSDYPLTIDVVYRVGGEMRITLLSGGSSVNGIPLATISQKLQTTLQRIMTDADATMHETSTNGFQAPQLNSKRSSAQTNGHAKSKFSWSSTAQVIRSEISRLCGVNEDEITEQTSIFELGLDSIDAIKLSSRLTGRGLKLPVSSIMQAATIYGMLQRDPSQTGNQISSQGLLEQAKFAITRSLNAELSSKKGKLEVLPATPLQEAMIQEMLSSEHNTYFNHDVLQLASDIEEARLKNAWQMVFEQTPILRTSFQEVDDPNVRNSYVQVVRKEVKLPWQVRRIRSRENIGDITEQVRRNVQEGAPGGVPWQLTMIQAKAERFLLLSMSHALYDGYSLDLIHQDVRKAYYKARVPSRPPSDSILEHMLQAQTSETASAFWSDHLSGAESCLIEVSQAQPHANASDGGTSRHELTSRLTAADVRAFCKTQAITAQTLGQSCFALVLSCYLRRLDLVHGLVLSGRETEEAESMTFPTMNTVAFRTILQGTKARFLQSTQRTMADVRANQHFPLRRAQNFAKSGDGKLFNTLFIFQSKPQLEVELGNLYESIGSSSDVELPICVELELHGDQVTWRAACHQNVFDMAATSNLLDQMELAREHLMTEPSAPLFDRHGDEITFGQLPSFAIRGQPGMTNGNHDVSQTVDRSSHDHEFSAELEIVRGIVSSVSQIPEHDIGYNTTLYHLGLDSISAIKVCSLLKKRGLGISVSELLRASTINAIANIVSRISESNGDSSNLDTAKIIAEACNEAKRMAQGASFEAKAVEAFLPATAGQRYMLEHWEHSRGTLFFDTFHFNASSEHIAPTTIPSAVAAWVRARPVLRTTFIKTSNSCMPLVQAILRADALELTHELDDAERLGSISLRGKASSGSKSTVTDRFAIVVSYERLGTHTWRIGLKIHHAFYDGVSLPSLLADFERLLINSDCSLLAAGLDGYRGFAAQSLLDSRKPSVKEFWTKYLAGASHLVFRKTDRGFDRAAQRLSRFRPAFVPGAQILVKIAKARGVTLPALFLATYAQALRRHTQQSGVKEIGNGGRLTIGTYMANRGHGLEELTNFPTVNLLPVVVDTTLPPFESAAQVQTDLIEISAASNVSVSLHQIEHWTGVRVDNFVNWVQLPEQDDADDGKLRDRFRIREEIDQVHDQRRADELVVPAWFRGDTPSTAYQPAVDVEVALRGESLDLGVFGPCDLITRDDAEAMFGSIREAFGRIVASA